MNLANKFSLTRLLLTPLFVLAVFYYKEDSLLLSNLPLIIFLAAVLTDVLDGFVARRYGQVTAVGKVLDPLADKFLLTAAFITLSLSKSIPVSLRIPPWVLIIVISRDIFIVIGAAIIYTLFKYIEFKPSGLGKATTFLQVATVLSVLLRFEYSYLVWSAAALVTVASGVHYLVRTNRTLSEKT